jgi:hypothetical protein
MSIFFKVEDPKHEVRNIVYNHFYYMFDRSDGVFVCVVSILDLIENDNEHGTLSYGG